MHTNRYAECLCAYGNLYGENFLFMRMWTVYWSKLSVRSDFEYLRYTDLSSSQWITAHCVRNEFEYYDLRLPGTIKLNGDFNNH